MPKTQNINTHTHNVMEPLTSSGVSLVSGWPWAARRAMAPVRILLRLIWRSGGGPPRGCPRTMMAQPDKTWSDDKDNYQLGRTNSAVLWPPFSLENPSTVISSNSPSSFILKTIYQKQRSQLNGHNTTFQRNQW